MNQLFQKIKAYLYDEKIDINERLGTFFVNIGILAAFLGVVICLLAHAPINGTICTALIAVTAPLFACIARHSKHSVRYGSLIAAMIIIMIPAVWLTTGTSTGGSGFWFLYELFYITLFTRKKQAIPYYVGAVIVQLAAVMADWLYPNMFFHFTNQTDALVSQLGSGFVVTAEIIITVLVQKSLYVHEQEINTKSQDMTRNFVTSIANTIDSKDPYTGGHSRRVAECASALALKLGMSVEEADNFYFVGLLHDLGKIGVPDSVLNKPGKLTDNEFSLIKKHPIYGAEILKEVEMIPHVHDGVLHHHECYDGSGYPDGLKGEEIPFVARVITVVDSFDAMSTNRIYRKRISREEIIDEMIRCRGTQFDPHIVDVFVTMLREGFDVKHAGNFRTDLKEYNQDVITREMMNHIMEESQAAGKRAGATNVDNIDFTKLYDYLCGLKIREKKEIILLSISLHMVSGQEDNERMLDSMVNLSRSISQNIRTVDLCTCNSSSSFLVLLLNAPQDKINSIIERISNDFYLMQGSREVVIKYDFIENNLYAPDSRVS